MSGFVGGSIVGSAAAGGGGLVSTTAGTFTGAPLTWNGTQWAEGTAVYGASARVAFYTLGGSELFIGTNNAYGEQMSAIHMYGASLNFGEAGTTAFYIDAGVFSLNYPIVGGTNSPYSEHGGVLVTLTDADKTLAAAEYKYQFIDIDQTATTATRTVTLPDPATKAAGYLKDIRCFGDAVRTITLKAGAGTETADFISGATGFVTGRVWVEPGIVRLVGATLAF